MEKIKRLKTRTIDNYNFKDYNVIGDIAETRKKVNEIVDKINEIVKWVNEISRLME